MEIQFQLNQKKIAEFSERLEKILFQRQEAGILHNTPLWNEELVEVILSGDETKIIHFMDGEIHLGGEVGYLAGNHLRNLKNLIICSVSSICTKVLWQESIDSEMVYSIADACIQMVEGTEKEKELFEVATAYCLTLCRYIRKTGDSIIRWSGRQKNMCFNISTKKSSLKKWRNRWEHPRLTSE